MCWLLLAGVGAARAVELRSRVLPTVAIARAAYVILVCLLPLVFHLATGEAVLASGKPLWDAQLVAIDTLLLGGFFPKGQLAIWADKSPSFAPSTFLGRCITEVLQWAYMSYYFWGNVLVVLLLVVYMRDPGSLTKWHRAQSLALGWVAAYLFTFTVNFLVPAVSPRLFLAADYSTPLEGLAFGRIFQAAIKSAAGGDPAHPKSFGAFPSGHVGQTWLAALAAERLGYHQYARAARWGALLMTLATQYLRYHYAIDAIVAGVALPLIGLWIAGLPTRLVRDATLLPL